MDKKINSILIRSMSFAQKEQVEDKKNFVLNIMKHTLGKEMFERYEPLINITIDMIKEISKNPKILEGLKNSKCFMGCTK